ncbi:RNA-directed DNA polymerase, eukaryota [Tanacetum coccineum]
MGIDDWQEVSRKNNRYRTKEDDVIKISISIYVSNFPESFSAKDLFHACSKYGHVVDSFIPSKRNSGTNVVGPNGGSLGNENTFANVLSKKPVPMSDVIDSQPVIVLDDDCVQSQDLTLSFMGKVLLEFKSLKVRDLFCENVGVKSWFSEITPASVDLCPDGRIVWVDVEGEPFKFWTANTFSRIAARWGKDVGIVFKGKVFWLRAKEVPGWEPEFLEIDDEEERSDKASMEEDEFIGNFSDKDEEVSETVFENASGTKQNASGTKVNVSEDPFGIYSILNKKNAVNAANEVTDSHSIPHPPGFTPVQEKACEDNDENIEHSKSNSGSKEEEAIREDLNSMSDKGGSVNMGRFKTTEAPRSDHRITRSGDGESMNFLSLNIQGLAQKAKKDWVRELAMKHKVNFLSIQETKMEEIDVFSVRNCWGNYSYDFLHSNSVGNSGYFVIVRGKWLKRDIDLLIVAIYAPHDPRDKRMVWDYLSHVINQWKGSVVIMGDFNEVRFKSDRFGSIFNEKGADEFNSFIANSGLEEVPLGGCNFTWCHKSAAKMSKLDRFLVSNNLFTYCPHISAITLDRFLSDHRPILLRETSFDYGPVPFRFFQHWIEIDGFSKFIEDTWNLAPVSGINALCVLISKMKFLKNRIREWINVSRVKTNGDIQCFKEELRVLDEVIDNGEGSDTILTKRLELINDIKRIEQLKAKEMAQKSKIKWAIEGDENSRFFHGMLNKKRNQLNIRGILVNGDWIDHPLEVKREFFNHFRDRFANSKDTRITIDMTFPKQISNDQKEDLERALTKDELKAAVWDCGTDKSPGPDGFTFGFYRHYWSVIEHDVFDAVNYFFNSGIIPKGGNPSFITLIPKIPAANLVKDFRPICLIGSIYKIIAKILANRLVGVLDNIVHEVQSAFISGRQILDGPFILNEMLQWCKTKKNQSLIFKVDFEKAFNSVRWDFLDDVLKKFSFGLKQGDPLSPFLFILIMESLHLSFQRVVDSGMFKGLNLSNSMCISHMFYADDVVFVGKWSDENINTLTNVLECFHRASGLKINMSKSKIMGVNVDENKVNLAASKLGCLSLYNPFSYLGMKVGDMMSRAQAWKEVVDKVKNRLSKWKMKALSIGGRLTLLKSVLGSIPIFHMSIFRVPLTVLQMLESLRGHFFNGHEIGSNKATWVKWEKVLTAKDKGGLGVASLYALNRGLLVKWFWRFYNQETSLWKNVIQAIHGRDGNVHSIKKSAVHSCWTTIVKEIRRLGVSGLNIFDFMKQKVGNGNIIKFWTDNWYHGGILKDIYPRLYALENRKDITVSSKLADPHLNTSFRRDIRGGCEMEQFQMLVDLVDSITLAPMEDRWVWNLEGSGEFSVASIRRKIDDSRLPTIGEKTRWVKFVPIKINVFAWKVTVNALPTRYNLSRRGMDIQSLSCPMCDCGIESTDHVFVGCDVSRQLGRMISNWWNTPLVEMDTIVVWKTWFSSIRLAPNLKSIFEGQLLLDGGLLTGRITDALDGALFSVVRTKDNVATAATLCNPRVRAFGKSKDWEVGDDSKGRV